MRYSKQSSDKSEFFILSFGPFSYSRILESFKVMMPMYKKRRSICPHSWLKNIKSYFYQIIRGTVMMPKKISIFCFL